MVSAVTLGNSIPKTSNAASALPAVYSSGGNIFSRALNFLDGDWARGMGADLRSSWESGTQFSARDSYHNFFGKRNIEYMADELVDKFKKNPVSDIEAAAKLSVQNKFGADVIRKNKGLTEQLGQTAKEVAEKVAKKPGFLSKIPGMKHVGRFFKGCFKRLGPIMIVGFAIKEAIDEVKNGGGLLGVGKVLCRTVLNEGGFIGGSLVAGALFGMGGLWAGLAGFALGIGGSMLGGWLGQKLFRTKTDEVEEAEKQAQEEQEKLAKQKKTVGNNPFYNQNLSKVAMDDPVLSYIRQQSATNPQLQGLGYLR